MIYGTNTRKFDFFYKKERYEDKEILPKNTLLSDFGIDGDDAVELLEHLEKEFNVSFEDFEFSRYFYGEGFNFSTIFKTLLGISREIKQELTIQELYYYMIAHKKEDNVPDELV